MADLVTDACADNVPAKSGVRDVIKVPFSLKLPATLSNGDTISLVKVAQGHRVVGYHIEMGQVDSSTGVTFDLGTKIGGTTSATAFFSGSQIGRATSSAVGQTSSRNNLGAVVTTTYTLGAIPSAEFSADGVVVLKVSNAVSAATAAGDTKAVSGYVEVQPA